MRNGSGDMRDPPLAGVVHCCNFKPEVHREGKLEKKSFSPKSTTTNN